MQSDKIKECLEKSISTLFQIDMFLLEHDVQEETICHRIAVYLEREIPEYHIDCEYNNDLDSPSGRKNVLYPGTNKENRFRPDIIVHKRGLNGRKNNKLIIEVKKMTSDKEKIEGDKAKLRACTTKESHLCYDIGALVIFGVKKDKGKYEILWFKDGEHVR